MRLSIQYEAKVFICTQIGSKIQIYSSEKDYKNFLKSCLLSRQPDKILTNDNFKTLLLEDYKTKKNSIIDIIDKNLLEKPEDIIMDHKINLIKNNSNTSNEDLSKIVEVLNSLIPDSEIPKNVLESIDKKFPCSNINRPNEDGNIA
jgi:hypothetical protein